MSTLLATTVRAQNVGIPQASFAPHYRIQQTLLWCWASSAEMVLSYQGVSLPQGAIVTRAIGAPVIQGGSPQDMINSTNGVFQNGAGQTVVVSGQFVMGPPTTAVLYNQMKAHRPVVLTYQNGPWSGHAVVLTGIDAQVTQLGVQIIRFYVFDPFPFVQQMGPMGPMGPQYVFVPGLQYQQLDISPTPYGLQLSRGGIAVGMLSGMILVDAS